MQGNNYKLGLSDLLDQSLTCYEYFHSLPKSLQEKIKDLDIHSFEDMQEYVANHSRGRYDNI
ncbi:MAG TPA: hypothetical protein PLG48_06590 [Candidatus Avimonas sp.]|nr:hypothetical protein [Clostridiales bacterium]HPU59158.1 hypothetical protein [Candidatus Avimonas sp.]